MMGINAGSMVLVKLEGDYFDGGIGKVGHMFLNDSGEVTFYVEFPESSKEYTSDQVILLTEDYVNKNYSFPGTKVEVLATNFRWQKGTIEHAFLDESLYSIMYSVRLDSGEKEVFYLDEFDVIEESEMKNEPKITFEVSYAIKSIADTRSESKTDATLPVYCAKIAVCLPVDENYTLIPELQSSLEFLGSPLSVVWGNTDLSDTEEKRRVKYIQVESYESWEQLENLIAEQKERVVSKLKDIFIAQSSVPKPTVEVVTL
jgi:hypothetical protein